MTTMQVFARGLYPRLLRKVARPLLYVAVGVQYIILLLMVRDASRRHPLPFRTLLLPLLYLAPLAVGFAYKRFIRTLSRNAVITVEVANACSDWITMLLLVVYGILLDFTALS